MTTKPASSRLPLASAVYEGVVRHRRHEPQAHAFSYRMAQLYLDLDEVERIFAERWLSEGEARRDALEYAVKPIDSGVLDEPRTWRDRPA